MKQSQAQIQSELFDLGMAYYCVAHVVCTMDAEHCLRGNRTDAYSSALLTMRHAKEYLWDQIRSHVVYFGINGDLTLDRAWLAWNRKRDWVARNRKREGEGKGEGR